jgi:hypothetical protein
MGCGAGALLFGAALAMGYPRCVDFAASSALAAILRGCAARDVHALAALLFLREHAVLGLLPKGRAWRGWLWIAALVAIATYVIWRVMVS